MHVVSLLCLQSGSPFVAGFMQGGNETDHRALLAFKAAITSDPFGALNSWNESIHFCQWLGVRCGRRHQRVTLLRIDHKKLSGSVSPHIGNLSFLRNLWLRNNSLSGEIPLELGHLRRLQKLSLLNNSISGGIPTNLSSCSNLVGLEFSGNRLTGEIPAELGSLSKLEGLYIAKNNLVGGSLEEWLHPNEIVEDARRESRHFNILQRLNIAIDVATAIDYLHHHSSNPILHCDLKPSNILLDDEMIGHVGDFGLARFLQEATYSSTTNQSSSIGIRGSVGYVAPEYGLANELSTCGDVYSYGILLLEMFTGKRPTDGMFSDSLTLHNFVKMSLPKKIAEIVDATLFQQREMGEASSSIDNNHSQSSHSSHKIRECLISLLKVGIACSEELPTNRLDMSDIVPQLHTIRNTLLETGVH